MKQKQQTKNKHSGSARARSDQCIMDKQNRLKSTLEGKIRRTETFIESADEETDSVEIKVKLRTVIALQKNVEELCNNYYAIPNVKDAELTAVDEDLHLLEVRLESLEQYREIIRDYTEQGIIEEVKTEITDNKLKRPVYYLPHQAIRKDGRLTSKTRIVLDAGSHQNNELSLNDCLWPGINLNPNLLDILINFRLNAIAFCSDIIQAFLQICLAEEHKDAVRFLWSDDEPCVHKRPKLQVYRFNRVNFGVSSSPFLLAATISHHIEKYKHEFPDTVEFLDKNFYVDDLISVGNEFEEALQTSRRAKNIMEAAGMDLRKWITNDANLMEQWKKENFNVHPVHETVSLGANGTKVLGLSWNTNEDYLTTDTKSLLEFVSLDKNTKRFILQVVVKIFDPLGLISPFTVRMKCLLQNLWKEEIQWDDPLPTHIEKEWKKWCEELPHLRNLKIPRLVLDSTLLEMIFNYNCRNKSKKVGPLTVAEFKESEIKLIKHAQRSLFDKEEIPSSISNLIPFVDGEGIVRVGGRLENASVPYLHKHPAILPKGSKLSKLYFNSLHTRLFHVGLQGLLNAVRQKFWPLSGRSIARKTVHQCVTCFKSRPILSSQIMGNLPSERAIHLELLSDLTFDALIATLKRFTSRRGKCSKIYTDNATNFVGANSILKKFRKSINFPDENLAKYFVSENIDWKFIPPKSPHFGGLWEAGVKSVKHHLKREIGNLHFTFEEFETIMIQVEGILNSRPLTPLSSDADNFDVLTPGHFLIGRPITSIPEPNLIDVNENRLSRWEKITKVVQRTWKKWKSDYLNTLQARSKWITEKNDLMIGQMVLIKEDFLPINTWPLGRILEVYHGSDGKVRVVSRLKLNQENLKELLVK
ncbi:integrase catalytic domain-containing protein [Trichonephila clavipes]|uniref:Integrase catalytic domain-containing protein n=1 Tax=Trichonephila clavipes TaxID=2585209 RepID=A0A8X6W8T2_TRICX|nr:integrase catalytic domain-containing protein [Trichonephila clavipes]